MKTKTETKLERTDAIKILKADHEKVKKLFEQFEESDNSQKKKKIAEQAIQELKIHAAIEEEIFYPAIREIIDDEENIMNEAEEEHHVAKVLLAELENGKEIDDEHFEAKFIVLAENIRHHIKEEEEGEMLPQAKKTDVDMEALGQKMMQRKQELMNGAIPETREDRMVAAAGR